MGEISLQKVKKIRNIDNEKLGGGKKKSLAKVIDVRGFFYRPQTLP